MPSTRFRTGKRLALLAVAICVWGAAAAQAKPPGHLSEDAVSKVAGRHGLALGDLVIVSTADIDLPLQGRAVFGFKVMDEHTGKVYTIRLNEAGEEVDWARLEAEERAAHERTYGRLDPALAQVLATASDTDRVDVVIWVQEPPFKPLERPAARSRPSREKLAEIFARMDAHRKGAVQAALSPTLRFLRARGFEVTPAEYSPALYASLTPDEALLVSFAPGVDRVYLAPVNRPELNVSGATVGTPTVHARGINGSGVYIGQIEVGGRIATSNPYLSGVTQDTTNVCSSASSHSTAVAGIIRSTHGTYKGAAPSATLWAGGSCSGDSTQLQNRSTAAVNWGARGLNLSWGSNIGLTPGANDRFYDDMVRNRAVTVVKSAGNEAGGCGAGNGNVTSPGLAYNLIAVGNLDDRNTTYKTDDVMSSCSSWRDPASTNGDREKPEVSAPGTNIVSTTTSSPWTGNAGSGTSFAAPMVTGTAALLMQRDTGLQAWPEGVKAILMATAWQNVEGASRLSEYDGAGGIMAPAADDVARDVHGNWGGQSYDCTTANPLDVTTMPLVAGNPARAALAWDTDHNYVSYTSQPSADLELQVIDPSSNVVAYSKSWDNTYEIVEFTPPSTGTYTLRVVRGRCDSSPGWIGWAWHSPNKPPVASFTADPSTGDSPLSVTFDASASYDPDGSIASYFWNFGDGTTSTGGPIVNHVFYSDGPYTAWYTVNLTVTDNEGASTTTWNTIVVSCNDPICPY